LPVCMCVHCDWQARVGREPRSPVRPCNGVTLSPPARSDCWGCAMRHGAKPVRPQGGAALFPCYSIAAARNLLTTAVRHAGVRGLTCQPSQGWAERQPPILCSEFWRSFSRCRHLPSRSTPRVGIRDGHEISSVRSAYMLTWPSADSLRRSAVSHRGSSWCGRGNASHTHSHPHTNLSDWQWAEPRDGVQTLHFF
jgi:hypothetical protein